MPSRRPARTRSRHALPVTSLLVAALLLPGAARAADPAAAVPGSFVGVPCTVLADGVVVERAVAVAAGGTLTLELCADAAAGYRWSDPRVADPAVLALGDWSWGPLADGRPGAPGAETLTFRAGTPGSTTIALDYRRPWEPSAPGDPRVLVTVHVADGEDAVATAVAAGAPAIDGVELVAPAGTRVRWSDSTTLARGLDQPFTALDGQGAYPLGMWLRLDLVLPDGTERAFTVTREGESSRTRAFVNHFDPGLWQCAVADRADRCVRPLGGHALAVGIAPDGGAVRIVVG